MSQRNQKATGVLIVHAERFFLNTKTVFDKPQLFDISIKVGEDASFYHAIQLLPANQTLDLNFDVPLFYFTNPVNILWATN